LPDCGQISYNLRLASNGPVAQSVEQRIENPCVGGSIPPRATNEFKHLRQLFQVGVFVSAHRVRAGVRRFSKSGFNRVAMRALGERNSVKWFFAAMALARSWLAG
jgi:hypothetical protein